MHAAAREHGLPLLDADRPMHDEGFVSPHDVHLTKEGYDRLAAILVPQVARILPPPKDR